jgi:hypothetical protein
MKTPCTSLRVRFEVAGDERTIDAPAIGLPSPAVTVPVTSSVGDCARATPGHTEKSETMSAKETHAARAAALGFPMGWLL